MAKYCRQPVYHEELQLKKKKKVTWHGGVLSTAGVPRGITVEEEEEGHVARWGTVNGRCSTRNYS